MNTGVRWAIGGGGRERGIEAAQIRHNEISFHSVYKQTCCCITYASAEPIYLTFL